jgi:RND family efflux transporter MFP subunit
MIGVLLAAGAMALAGCTAGAKSDPPSPPVVIVAKPVTRQVTDYFEFFGETAAVNEVELRSRVTGYIKKVAFEDGQEVKAGDLLFQIDPDPYQAALDRAKGESERLAALLKKAQTDLARSERLRPSGAISQDEYEQHAANLKVHEASIHSAAAAVREADLNLKFTRVTAPINGRVSRARIKEGNLVQAGQGEGTVLTTVVTVSPIYVYFHIEEPALLKYLDLDWRSGRDRLPSLIKDLKIPVEIGLASQQESFPYAGTLDFLDNKVDRGTGTICARGVFDNSKQNLTPGLYVRVRVPIGKPHRAVLVSDRAIVTDQRQKYVLRVNQQNVVEYLPVTLGARRDGLRVIEKGLDPESRIIVKGLQRARRGEPVTPKQAEETVAASPAPRKDEG